MAVGLDNLGLKAMEDVTYLNGRAHNHADHKLFKAKKLTIKMMARDVFHKMSGQEQEAYVYRLALTRYVQLPQGDCVATCFSATLRSFYRYLYLLVLVG